MSLKFSKIPLWRCSLNVFVIAIVFVVVFLIVFFSLVNVNHTGGDTVLWHVVIGVIGNVGAAGDSGGGSIGAAGGCGGGSIGAAGGCGGGGGGVLEG